MKKLLTLLLIVLTISVYGQQSNTTNTKFTNGLAVPNGVAQKPTSGITTGALSYVDGVGLYVYNGSSWVLLGISGAGVTSFNSRTGAVVPLTGDYSSFYVPLTRTVAGFDLSANVTLASLTPGYGVSGSAYNGSVARTLTADTTSATGLVSKSRLAAYTYTKAQSDEKYIQNQTSVIQTGSYNISGSSTIHGFGVGYAGYFVLKNPVSLLTPFYTYSDSTNVRLFTDNIVGLRSGSGNGGADFSRYSYADNGSSATLNYSIKRSNGNFLINDLASNDDGNKLQVNGTITSRLNSIIGKTEAQSDSTNKMASTAYVRQFTESARLRLDSLSINIGLVQKADTVVAIGDSQMYGTNSAYSGSRLPAPYRIPDIYARTQNKSLTVNNIAVPASRLSWAPSVNAWIQQGSFNTLGNLTPGWQGVLISMAGWNNIYTDLPDTMVSTMRNAYQGIIARGLIDGYAGISASGWDYAKTANVNSWVTSGDTQSDASVVSPSTNFTPFATNVNTDPRYKTELVTSDSLKFTLTDKRAIALFYDTDTLSGGGFDVYVNNYKVGSYNSTYKDSHNNTDRWSQVVWIENVPASATVKMIQTGVGKTNFLAYGWVNLTSSLVNKKTIVMGGVTGDTANVRRPKDLWRINLAAQQAAGAFTGYPVFFADTFNPFYHPTDQEPSDISHLTPTGSLHMAEAFNSAITPKPSISPNFVILSGLALVPNWVGGTLTRLMAYNQSNKRAEYITPSQAISVLNTTTFNINGNSATTTSLAGGLGGQIPYQSAASTTAFLANGSAGQVLKSNGTTLAPSWVTDGGGTVTSVSVTTANGISGSVANPTSTPAITLSLGAITPTSTNGVSATTMAYNDATSSIQTQLNGKQATLTPAALTKTDDTNVTLTLGGTPTTALLQATSLTLGWTGQLGSTRGGSGVSNAGTLTWGSGGTLGTAAYTNTGAYEVPLTFSTGLTRSTNTITVNQAFSPTWTGTHTFSGGNGGSEKIFLTNTTASTGRTYSFNSYTDGSLYFGDESVGNRFEIDNAGKWTINVAPTTSAGTYDILTRNTSTGKLEKIASSSSTYAPFTALSGAGATVGTLSFGFTANEVGFFVHNGTTTTITLPTTGGSTNTAILYLKNRGSGNITINSNGGGNDIYSTSAVATYSVTPGNSIIITFDGTYFNIQ